MDRVLRLRDEDLKKGDQSSGLPQGAEDWFVNEQLPNLLNNPYYRKQLEEHISDLKAKSDQMNKDLQKVFQADLEAQEKIDETANKFSEMLK